MSDEQTTEVHTKKHTLSLTNGAASMIKEALATPSWYKEDPACMYTACQMAETVLIDINEPHEASDEVVEAWRNESCALQVTERQREVIKRCIRYYRDQAALRPTRHAGALLYELGLTDG